MLTEDQFNVWVTALRTGEYKGTKYEQGRGSLCNRDGEFCCLGVLADAVIPGKWWREGETSWFFRPDSAPDPSVGKDWLSNLWGLDAIPSGVAGRLIDMNDGNGYDTPGLSFTEIADWLEANKNLVVAQ